MKMIEFPLSVSNRCPKRVVEEANLYAPDMKAKEGASEGEVLECTEDEMLLAALPEDFILCRTKAQTVNIALKLLVNDAPIQILGKNLGAQCKYLLSKVLKDCKSENLMDIAGYLISVENQSKLLDDKDLFEAEDDVDVLMELVKNCTTLQQVQAKIDKLFCAEMPLSDKIILSTIHKAKGLEANRVFVVMDKLPHPKVLKTGNPDLIEQDAVNLPYVAFTRSKDVLFKVIKHVKEED